MLRAGSLMKMKEALETSVLLTCAETLAWLGRASPASLGNAGKRRMQGLGHGLTSGEKYWWARGEAWKMKSFGGLLTGLECELETWLAGNSVLWLAG